MADASSPPAALEARLKSAFGPGAPWTAGTQLSTTLWAMEQLDLVWMASTQRESDLRSAWRVRRGGGATPVVVVAPSSQAGRVRVLGPEDPQGPVRTLPAEAVFTLLTEVRTRSRREVASILAAEFLRLDESGIPGIGIKGLLTRHFLLDRLRTNQNDWAHLTAAIGGLRPGMDSQDTLRAMGYRLDPTSTGYVLRAGDEPVAVAHAYPDETLFGHLTSAGSLPEGLVLAECTRYGAGWGILFTPRRLRLFQHNPPLGSATGRYLDIDPRALSPSDRPYIGLLAPDSLKRGGWMYGCINQAKDFGEELRKGLEHRLRLDALPAIARGLAEYLANEAKADVSDRGVLQEIEAAALTLVFRLIFVLYAEAADELPLASESYRTYSATELAYQARRDRPRLDLNSTRLWDSLARLVRMVRHGDRAVGVPAYNGSLFAASGFPGGELVERAKVKDIHLAPAITAIAFRTDEPDAPGLDYAGLQFGHLGAIYEGLLALRLTHSRQPLRYDERLDRYLPARAGDKVAVESDQVFYQTEAGGRKAGGVFYTRHEFVRHLLDHSLAPALNEHLHKVAKTAETDPVRAAQQLFDFTVVDPAMGSGHFLTGAVDVMADRIEAFLAERPLPDVRELLDKLKVDGDGVADRVYDDNALLRRLILKRCIYGVDLSPMAVEVANISLWLASFVPGLALSYLGSNLKVGDALIGASDLDAVRSTSPLFSAENTKSPLRGYMDRALKVASELAAIPDRTPAEVEQSRAKERELDEVTAPLARAMDLWCAEPLGVEGARHLLETGEINEVLSGRLRGAGAALVKAAQEEAQRRRFLHWPLAFPSVFLREWPGFDVVVGNPPWNEMNLEELGFYALHDPGLRGLPDERDRRARIQQLDRLFPELREEFDRRFQDLVTQRQFFRPENGYEKQGKGNLDIYELFCERYGHLARGGGWLGVVLPRSAFLGEGARGFRRWLFRENTVRRVDSLLNSTRWAFDMEQRYTISLLTAQRVPPSADAALHQSGPSADLDAFLAAAKADGVAVALDNLRAWTPAPPDDPVREPSWEVPLLPTQAAVPVFEKLRQGPRFDQGYAKIWRAFATQGDMNETSDKILFRYATGTPVWKGRSFDQYDPHGSEPAGYGRVKELEDFLQKKRLSPRSQFHRNRNAFPRGYLQDPRTLPLHHARIAFRDVTNRTNSRTVIACLIPPETGLTNKAPYLTFPLGEALAQVFVLGVLNSLPFDWQARRLVETNLNFFILNMLCFPPPDRTPWKRIGKLAARLSCVDERFAEFARETGVECGPLGEDAVGLRVEIDALVARAYGLDEADLHTIFQDFTQGAVSPAYRERLLKQFRAMKI